MAVWERSGHPGAASWRRVLGALTSLAWMAVAVGIGWFLWPTSLGGCTTLTIVSGQSMEPTYYTGDLVVSRCGEPEVGDVVVYNPPDVGGARVIHRIVGGDATQGWLIQGDNNDFLDPWQPTNERILGSAVLHLPHVGKFAAILLSPLTWISLLTVALAVVVWPGRGKATDEAADADAAEPEPADGEPADGEPAGGEPADVEQSDVEQADGELATDQAPTH